MKKNIAFFDFDGTITTKDTLLEFIKFSKGEFNFLLGFLLNIHYLLAYKLKIITNQAAKEKILRFFFQSMAVEEFEKYCREFHSRALPNLIRPKALEEISKLQAGGSVVVVVSASPENWIAQWAKDEGVQLIASRLEVRNGQITGKIVGKNCHGDEKVQRITKLYNLSEYNVVAAYGDTSGDKPMLKLAASSFFKPFR